ncbi:intraflagellar transport protein 74 homolog [Aricia agestis]|uniref:intraflagellar transport protein 74 homolog n=1 Tax=Aricia agestis TaxID=91739 RepID=UPI001C209587|nr:intraflagellar transport protein 74 homolog [Aricia agestis]
MDQCEERGSARPVSRRGYREYTNSGSDMSRSGSVRPGSAYRGPSRLATAGFGPAPPTAPATRQAAATGFPMVDRPITQQGISGARASTARGGARRARQLHDRRYWEELLQLRARDTRAEIARLAERAAAGERERSARKHYEKRVRELAHELTDLQGRLADYNTAIRIASGEASAAAVEEQARELAATNAGMQRDLEHLLLDKQRKENQLRQLRDQTDEERSTISKLLSEMSAQEREQYDRLERAAVALRDDVDRARTHIDRLRREKDEFIKDISGSQIKLHLLELHGKLAAAEEKRDTIRNEINDRLDPQEEREKLLGQVREDNAAIASLDGSAANLKEQIEKVQELIEQAEQDLEEGNSERHQKYRELKKREETMDGFMSTYDENLRREHENIERLERDIVFALEHTSSNIDLDLGEIDALKEREGFDESKKTVETLRRDYERYQSNLRKAEATRERLAAELQTLPERSRAMRDELAVLADLDKLRDDGEIEKKSLESSARLLREKLAPTRSAVREAAAKLDRLQAGLAGDATYARLSGLEERLARLAERRGVLRNDVASAAVAARYEPLRADALRRLAALNDRLVADARSAAPPY